jgi:hypothetical protein
MISTAMPLAGPIKNQKDAFMSSELQGTGLDIQIIEARIKTNTLIVTGTAAAFRLTIDTASGMDPLEPIDTSDWYVDEEIDPLPGAPIGPDIPGVNEDETEDLTHQIQEVRVSFQVGFAAPTAFELAVPTGPASAEWSSWSFKKPLPLGGFKRKIIITAEVRMGAKTETTTLEISGLSIHRPSLSLAKLETR